MDFMPPFLLLLVILKFVISGYVKDAEKIKGKGMKKIICVAVNDPFVTEAWGKEQLCICHISFDQVSI